MVSDCGGCGPTEVVVPVKGGLGNTGKSKVSAFNLADLPNPILKEIRDIKEIQKFHKDHHLVPYAGTVEYSGDALREFLHSMTYLSPTHGACIESKKRVSLGKLQVINMQDFDFDIGQDREVSSETARAYLEAIKEVQVSKSIKDLACDFHDDWEATGDQFLEVIVSEALGVKTYSFERHAPENCKYLATKKGEQRFVVISPIWTDRYLKDNPPPIIPTFPAFLEMEDGTSRSIIHRKAGRGSWYGRPPALSSLFYQYREFQDANYLIKAAQGNFTGQIIMEWEDDDPNATEANARAAGFESEAERIEKNFTNKGNDPSSVLAMARPYGSHPMFVFQVKPNTSENFYKVTGEIAESKVIRAHGWNAKLMDDGSATGLSSNLFMDVLKSRLTVIQSVQQNAVSIIQKALDFVMLDRGLNDFVNLGLQFKSPYAEILDQQNQAEKDDPNNNQGGGSNQA